MPDGTVNILEGSTFVVSDASGDVDPDPERADGLFYRDMRHLSRWQLRLNGRRLDALYGEAIEYDDALFYLREHSGSVYTNPPVSIIRRRRVGEGLRESLQVVNHGVEQVALHVSLLFDADFSDIFEVKDRTPKTGRRYYRVADDHVTLGYERGDFRRETRIRAAGAEYTPQSLLFALTLAPNQTWCAEVEVSVATAGARPTPRREFQRPNTPTSLRDWLDAAPRLDTDWNDLHRVYRRSLVDLAALRFYPDVTPDASLPAAGLPWFMGLFGRDALIVSYQVLPFAPELCATALRALAARQARQVDDFRDAEPGKILHEVRHGELTYFHERPQSPYYGSADATPLFLIVLDEYHRWTGDGDLVRHLEAPARAALAWMRDYGQRLGDGFIAYRTRNPSSGLVNQCWKDSWNAIVHPDGALASLPRATCEVQGYAYDAYRRVARLARRCWHDPSLAERLDHAADELRTRFVDAFWLPDEGRYALALDGQHRPVRTLASNMGQLLWSGIVPDEHVDPVVDHLMDDTMFSGWGIRTLAAGQGAYNPTEYHNGTVWPHDNSIIAAGLARYGRHEQAGRVAAGILEAAAGLRFRLPEALVGAGRAQTHAPVPYPSACSPQAWASGAPLLMLRTLLGLRPDGQRLLADPHLPERIRRLHLRGVPGRWGRADVGAGD